MAMKPNYNRQRAERTRAKQQSKKEKLERRQEESGQREPQPDDQPIVAGTSEEPEHGGGLGS